MVIEFRDPVDIGSILLVSDDTPKVTLELKIGTSMYVQEARSMQMITNDGAVSCPFYGA